MLFRMVGINRIEGRVKKLFGDFFVVDTDDELEPGGRIHEKNVNCSAILGAVLLAVFVLIFLCL